MPDLAKRRLDGLVAPGFGGKHAAVLRLAHGGAGLGHEPREVGPEDLARVLLLDAGRAEPGALVDEHAALHGKLAGLADELGEAPRLAQADDAHVADDEDAIGAAHHGLAPRQPERGHVDDDAVELGGGEVEQPADDLRIEVQRGRSEGGAASSAKPRGAASA